MRDLRGSYMATIDKAHRMLLPKGLRDFLSEPSTGLSFVIRPGRSHAGTLDLIPRRLFERVRANELPLSALTPEQRRWRVFENSNTHDVSMDGQYRLALPQVLLQNARIGSNVCLVGQEDHIQLWSLDTYRAFQQEAWDNYAGYIQNVSWGTPGGDAVASERAVLPSVDAGSSGQCRHEGPVQGQAG